jgi:hypothetical protein
MIDWNWERAGISAEMQGSENPEHPGKPGPCQASETWHRGAWQELSFQPLAVRLNFFTLRPLAADLFRPAFEAAVRLLLYYNVGHGNLRRFFPAACSSLHRPYRFRAVRSQVLSSAGMRPTCRSARSSGLPGVLRAEYQKTNAGIALRSVTGVVAGFGLYSQWRKSVKQWRRTVHQRPNATVADRTD